MSSKRHAASSGAKTRKAEGPVSSAETSALFADWKSAPALVLAVSGGPDSTALLWLAARWRARQKRGPALVAATVDHGLRKESAQEARAVAALARSLRVDHVTLRWRGDKPTSGLPAAAREARYRLLAEAARRAGAAAILTAHTRDDQAETLLMRLCRGSGLAGLAAMRRHVPRGSLAIGRPFLDIPKARLIATLAKARIAFADDPTNYEAAFTRARLRKLMPLMAREGLDAHNLARLARRLSRANSALEAVAGVMEQAIGRLAAPGHVEIDARAFATLPAEIALRLLGRAIAQVGTEGPAELAKLESLSAAVQRAVSAKSADSTALRLKQTLAGAVIAASPAIVSVKTAPPRRPAMTKAVSEA